MKTESEKHTAEVQEKWGKTEAYKAYEAKTRHYTGQKWNAIADGMDQILAAFSLCMKDGKAPNSPEAQSLVQQLQDHITEHYYPCNNPILAGLGQMYVADQRFKNNIDKHADGTAAFISEAIAAYCNQ